MNHLKLESLARIPRPLSADLEKICVKPFFFLRGAVRRWTEQIQNGPLVFAVVVQANPCLFDKEESRWAPAMLAYTDDRRYVRDANWIRGVADRLAAIRDERTGDPALDAIGDLLRDDDSSFIHKPLPPSLTGDARAFITTTHVNPDRLPDRVIPPSRVLPALLMGEEINLVPPDLYLS